MVAAVVTNSVFGFLRFAVMLAVLDGGARIVAGYDEPRLATFVWARQGLIGVVLLWAPPDLAERMTRRARWLARRSPRAVWLPAPRRRGS
jgi:hypothetical protein